MGYMASGKTTLGRALAKTLGRGFIDLDFYIEQRFRTTIDRIFATKGEEEFRRMEREMLREVGEMQNVVIACGGGTPCFHDNMDYMLSRGATIYLETAENRILERLLRNRARRPLMAEKKEEELAAEIHAGLTARLPHYTRAQIRHRGEQLESRRQISDTIAALLAAHPEL